jgi:hypothetical protein
MLNLECCELMALAMEEALALNSMYTSYSSIIIYKDGSSKVKPG